MPSASITSTISGSPIVGASRDDAVAGSVVALASTNAHTTYAWSLAYRPPGSTAAFSGSSTAASPGTFTVDVEGPYLVRLTADLGLATESKQYVRVRYLTVLGSLKLVAAGEGYGGAIPVPVDQTATGWTDALNTNLLTLLGLVGSVASSGDVLYVDPTEGYGDFTSVQDAIDAAVAAGASSVAPYVVMVRPGVYVEDVTFHPAVYVVGAPGSPAETTAAPLVTIWGAHTVALSGGSDSLVLSHVALVNITSSTNATVLKTGAGTVWFHQCVLNQSGLNVAQGPALRVDAGTAYLYECQVVADAALNDDRAAITQPSNSTLVVRRSTVTGPTGLILNSTFGTTVSTTISDSSVRCTGGGGVGITSDATTLLIEKSEVSCVSTVPLYVHPGAGAFASSQSVTVRWSDLNGDVLFDTTGIVGATTLELGASEYGQLVYPGGAPTTVRATTVGTSLAYDNTSSGLTAENVQDAIDEVVVLAEAVRTLDDAYDGGTPGSGSGRTIVADAGAVRISDAPMASDPPAAGATNGRLEVVSSIRVGAIDYPEISVDPNPYGSGPSVLMGNRVVPNNNPWGAGTATVMARSTGTPSFRNYTLRVQTQSSAGGGAIGRLILQGGDGLDNGASTPDASSVYVQAGSAYDATAVPGSVFIAPGRRTGGAAGSIVLVRPEGSTPATLTAGGACADPIGVAGSITFGTNMGGVTATFLAGDSLATVVAKLDALEGLSAAEAGGVITLTTDHEGPNAEVYFLSATTGVDAAIGGFDGVPQVDGTYGEYIAVEVSADQEVTFGAGAANPMVYNATTGKLTVPGLIDPTGMVFTTASAPGTGASEGAIFVSDGSGGLTVGTVYFQGPSNAAPVVIATPTGSGSFTVSDGINNNVTNVVTIAHTYNAGPGASGIGAGFLFQAEDSASAVVDAARVAGILTTATAGAVTGGLSFSTRTGGGSLTERWQIIGAGSLSPASDNAYAVGLNSNRVSAFNGVLFQSFIAASDVNPAYSISSLGFNGGAGGASAVDVLLSRVNSGGPLWSMSVGLLVGGNVLRNEGSIIFGTSRTNTGAGDAVTLQASNAVAAAGTSQPGGQVAIYGSSAAAVGPGNFAASGGQVVIQAGNSAAINAAQQSGSNVTIQGGAAASGVGGGAANGGGVNLVGTSGAGGGNGGDVVLSPGALDGAGADGNVVFRVNGASRTPSLLPRVTGEGGIGSSSFRWANLYYVSENSSGQKVVSVANKSFANSPYTVASTDYVLLYDPTGGSSTVNLPAAASSAGRVLLVKHSSASVNTVTLDGDAAETIDGSATLVLNSYQSATLVCDGVGWSIL